jgi:hypothetical protein
MTSVSLVVTGHIPADTRRSWISNGLAGSESAGLYSVRNQARCIPLGARLQAHRSHMLACLSARAPCAHSASQSAVHTASHTSDTRVPTATTELRLEHASGLSSTLSSTRRSGTARSDVACVGKCSLLSAPCWTKQEFVLTCTGGHHERPPKLGLTTEMSDASRGHASVPLPHCVCRC